MAKRGRNNLLTEKDGDEFETEAFDYLNEPKETSKNVPADEESDVELSGSEESGSDEGDLLDEAKRNSDKDDDDAPEAIGFAASKNTVLQQFRVAMKQIESEKQRKKDKRKKLLEQFKDQKSQKLKELSETKLPEELLQSLDSEIPKKRKKTSNSKVKQKEAKKEIENDVSSDLSEMEEDSAALGSNYIPLSGMVDRSSGVEVVKIGDQKMSKSPAELAAEFRKNRLYGNNIPRETTKQKMSKEEKRKARFR